MWERTMDGHDVRKYKREIESGKGVLVGPDSVGGTYTV